MSDNSIESNVQAQLLHDRILAEERSISFDRFDHADAWAVGSRLVEVARQRRHPVAIAVVFGEQRVFHAALPGSSANNDDWLDRKFRAVRRHDCSSYALGCAQRAAGADYFRDNGYERRDLAIAGGAVPLRVSGSLIGAVGVSGLAEEEDHALVVEILSEFLRAD